MLVEFDITSINEGYWLNPPAGYAASPNTAQPRRVGTLFMMSNPSGNPVLWYRVAPMTSQAKLAMFRTNTVQNIAGLHSCCIVTGSTGSGYMLSYNSTENAVKVEILTAAVRGTVLLTIPVGGTSDNDMTRFDFVLLPDCSFYVYKEGIMIGSGNDPQQTYPNANQNGVFLQGSSSKVGGWGGESLSGVVTAATANPVAGDPITVSGVGFTNGAAELLFGAKTVDVTINNNAFTVNLPPLEDGSNYPLLPSPATLFNVRQSGNDALFTRPIAIPANHKTIIFANLRLDETYLAEILAGANESIANGDRCFWVNANGLDVYPDSRIVINNSALPLTQRFIVQRANTNITFYDIPLEADVSTRNPNIGAWVVQSSSPLLDGTSPKTLRP